MEEEENMDIDEYGEEEDEEEKDEDLEEESDYDEEGCPEKLKNNAKFSGEHQSFQPLNAQHLHNSHLYKRGPTKYQKASSDYYGSNSKGHWTKEEDLALADAVKKN